MVRIVACGPRLAQRRGKGGRSECERVLIGEVISSGPTQTLATVMQFASERQRLIAHNIANLSTPGFVALDVSVDDFRESLREAVDARREHSGAGGGGFAWSGSDEVRPGPGGSLHLSPATPMGGVLYQDGTNRDPERLMQALAENVAAYRIASDLMRSHGQMIRAAITMRP